VRRGRSVAERRREWLQRPLAEARRSEYPSAPQRQPVYYKHFGAQAHVPPIPPMKHPTPSQLDAARRLFACEGQGRGGSTGAEERAAAGPRIFDETLARLATVLGSTGARALFARSVKLAAPAFPSLAAVRVSVEGDDGLGEQVALCLRGQTPEQVTDTMVKLYATWLAQLETLIGEQLTTAVLRDSWPAFRAGAPEEETKS